MAMPTTTPDYLAELEARQAIYERIMGIPTAGQSLYQKWVAKQWQTASFEYESRKALGLIPADQSFADFVASLQGQPLSRISPGVEAGIRGLGGTQTAETADVAQFFNLPGQWERVYGAMKGIPAAGRSLWENWLASQWQGPATQYALQSAGLFGQPTTGPSITTGAKTWAQYLAQQAGQPVSRMGGGYLGALTSLEPTAQRAMLENLPDYVEPTAFYGAAAERYPQFIAAGLTGQAFGEPAERRWRVSPEQIGGMAWLNYLKQQYGL